MFLDLVCIYFVVVIILSCSIHTYFNHLPTGDVFTNRRQLESGWQKIIPAYTTGPGQVKWHPDTENLLGPASYSAGIGLEEWDSRCRQLT